jgi:hypothetical protein
MALRRLLALGSLRLTDMQAEHARVGVVVGVVEGDRAASGSRASPASSSSAMSTFAEHPEVSCSMGREKRRQERRFAFAGRAQGKGWGKKGVNGPCGTAFQSGFAEAASR